MTDITADNLTSTVRDICFATPITDIHTHIYSAPFGELLLRGVDELLTYHYLVAEVFRVNPMPYDTWWKLPKTEQADIIWQKLFIERSPISEACRGVLTSLKLFGLEDELKRRDLNAIRTFFNGLSPQEHIDRVFSLANVKKVVMTNNPFDPLEYPIWMKERDNDPRFEAALRMDNIIMTWEAACPTLNEWGYAVDPELSDRSKSELTRYLADWTDRMNPRYMAVSLPPDFMFPDDSIRGRLLKEVIFPFCQQRHLPFAMMIGVWKLVNAGLKLAGDAVGKADIKVVGNIANAYPDVKFLVTFLSRENTHEQAVYARKFHNMMVFGCWWYLNNPELINEITRIRMEMLGLSFVPQHSDARVLDQLLYKWTHSREIIAKVLSDKYADLLKAGWMLTRQEIQRDVALLFGNTFEEFLAR